MTITNETTLGELQDQLRRSGFRLCVFLTGTAWRVTIEDDRHYGKGRGETIAAAIAEAIEDGYTKRDCNDDEPSPLRRLTPSDPNTCDDCGANLLLTGMQHNPGCSD